MKPINLIKHPEGGRFCEVFRSHAQIKNAAEQERCALTHIYFYLESDEVSHFHRVGSDEVWNLYQGSGIHLYLWNGSAKAATQVTLSAENREFCHVVPAGIWQAAVPIHGSVLVGCSVAPGFEFTDFEMMQSNSDEAQVLRSNNLELNKLIIAYRDRDGHR